MTSDNPNSKTENAAAFIERIESPRGIRFRALEGVRNLCLEISYRGEGFMGYQSQPHGNTVQDTLNKAWLTLTQENTTLYGCSRLDAGVHAQQYFLNLFTRSTRDCEDITRSLNGILRSAMNTAISVYRCFEVSPDFNARFDTLGKHYRYRLWYGRGHHAALTPAAWAIRSRDFNLNLLNQALQDCVGEHDFSAFRASDCTAKSTVRKILKIEIERNGQYPESLCIDFYGEGFLKNMIRNIVGTTVDIAVGKLQQNAVTSAFEHLERTRVGQCAPAHALTLERVFYAQAEWEKTTGKGT
jgi:tRNA pseudouridine38-40 synthase